MFPVAVCRAQGAVASIKAEQEALQRRIREKELMLRQCKLAQAAVEEVRDGLPNLRFQVEQLQRDNGAVELKIKSQAKMMEEVRGHARVAPARLCSRHLHARLFKRAGTPPGAQVKRDLDISMNDFLKEEAIGKDKAAMFAVTAKQVW